MGVEVVAAAEEVLVHFVVIGFVHVHGGIRFFYCY